MAKRGSSGLSFLLGVDKPEGLSSHDVVTRIRRLFHERRVGHMGTLDPAASGVLVVAVGPATRLDAYLSHDRKRYRARIVFGMATDTDDREGQAIYRHEWRDEQRRLLEDADFASAVLGALRGRHEQIPPRYSAIKQNGVCAYEAARQGKTMRLEPRPIEIYEASLVSCDGGDSPSWEVELLVSKGCYIRSIARDLGDQLGCGAYLAALRRVSAGAVDLVQCQSLDELESLDQRGLLGPDQLYEQKLVLDPLELLGFRFVRGDEHVARKAAAGQDLSATIALYERDHEGRIVHSRRAPRAGELIGVVAQNALCALYGFDGKAGLWRSRCGFSIGVQRGHRTSFR